MARGWESKAVEDQLNQAELREAPREQPYADTPEARARLARLRALGKHHLPAGHRHALHADQDPHERILAFSASKIGLDPTAATVAG